MAAARPLLPALVDGVASETGLGADNNIRNNNYLMPQKVEPHGWVWYAVTK
jgi:hypothetical protein